MLTIVNKENEIARSFQLTVGLIEGYTDGKLHDQEEVGKIVAEWLLGQKRDNKPYLPGYITVGTIYYYGRESAKLITEPVALYGGDVSPEYNADLTDDEVISTLHELAEILAVKLNQVRIYLRYGGIIQILQQS